jgi:hypothetical protein
MRRRLMPVAAAVLLLSGCHRAAKTTAPPSAKPEDPVVVFARTTFEALAKGDPAVRDKLAWDCFNDKGRDVGGEWRARPRGEARQKFEQDFLAGFAAPYKFYPQGSLLPNWRKLGSHRGRTVVQADLGPRTKMYFFVVDTFRHRLFAGWDTKPE